MNHLRISYKSRLIEIFFLLGHIRLQRITAPEREERKRIDKKEKKEREEEEERNRLTYNFVKYTLGLKHQVSVKT